MPLCVYINKITWESEVSGIPFGEIIFKESTHKDNPDIPLERYSYVLSRINPEDKNFEEKLYLLASKGFKLSDVFIMFNMKFPHLQTEPDFSRWENYKVFSGKEITDNMLKDLLEISIEKMDVSRYFLELPRNIAEKIYKKWILDLVKYGRSFVLYDMAENKLKGFLGCMISENKYKNFILFGEGMSFILLAKSFIIGCAPDKIDEMEFKVSIRNLRALKIISKLIECREKKISFEFVFSKINI